MKKISNLLMMALLTIGMGLTACSNKDIASFNNPLGSDIYGLWYADYQESGTVGNDTPYSRVLQAVQLNSDGTGRWFWAAFNADNATTPLLFEGGQYNGAFSYTVAADGTITAKPQMDNCPMPRSFRFANGAITFDDNGAQTMKAAPEGYENMLLALEKSTYGADADTYNINDKDFKVDQWRQQEAIYIYDGVSKGIKDENGNEGYASVNLPWYNGTVISNLPMDFCADITPENGWEWVLNYCGRRSTPNGNFFALYNRYLGILRFFYYMPQGYGAGNDHLWQITMTQGLSDRYDLRYGIPMDKTVSAKNAYGLTADGTSWADDSTPYVSTMSNDGYINPNPGWWAFDVDLSTYRTETIDPNAEKIRLQMRSWDNSHVSLFSTLAENKDNLADLTKAAANKSKGLFGKIKDVVKVGTNLGKTIASLRKGDLKAGITNGIEFGKSAIALKGTFSSGGGGESAPSGTISFITTGKANTDGVISSSQPTVGIVSPTFLVSTDFKNDNTIGQGIWNIKSTPKIYTTNSANSVHNFLPDKRRFDKQTFFESWLTDAANWTFFDPSSVEVVLNPNVFPEDQIEWMQVDAVAGLRKSLTTQEVDSFRTTLGMEAIATKKIVDDQVRWTKDCGNEANDYVFNYVAAENSPEQTLELTYPKSIDNGNTGFKIKTLVLINDQYFGYDGKVEQQLRTFGAGTGDDYIIEPQMTFWRDGMYNLSVPSGFCKDIVNTIARYARADDRNGKPAAFDYGELSRGRFDPNSEDNGLTSYVVGYDDDGKNGFPKTYTATIDIKHIPAYFPTAEINVTLTIKMKNMAEPIVYNRIYLPEYEYVKVAGDEKASLAILDRILAKKNLSPKTKGHTQSYDFQAARINKCFKLLFGYSR